MNILDHYDAIYHMWPFMDGTTRLHLFQTCKAFYTSDDFKKMYLYTLRTMSKAYIKRVTRR